MARQTLSQPRSYTNLVRLGVVALVFALLIFYAATTLKQYFEVREVSLPSVVGLPKDEAVALLESLNLEPLVFSETVAGTAFGTVTSQTPKPEATVRAGRSVSLGVNEAGAGAPVPQLVGVTQAEAEARLSAAGLQLGGVTFRFGEEPDGQVVGQGVAAGETVGATSEVDLVVSRGPEVARVALPRLRGLNIDAAKNRLRSLGFSNVVTTATGVSFDRPFTVTDQFPPAGETAPANTQVVLHYTLSTNTVAQVPDLSGLPLSSAQLLLNASGLTLGPVTYVTDPAQSGGVVTFEPSGYTLTGSPVGLTLNRVGAFRTDLPAPLGQNGAAPANATEYDVTNDDATNGGVGNGNVINGGAVDNGIVNSGTANPADSATSAGANPQITPLNVPGGRVIPFVFDPVQQGVTANGQAYKLTLKVVDDQGERVVYENVVGPDEVIRTDVPVYGEAQLQTFINDNIYQAWSP